MWALQSPDETLDWHMDWSDFMETGDVIDSSSWELDQPGVDSPALVDGGYLALLHITTVTVSGLELGKSYRLKNTIITQNGNTGVREITIRCDLQ